MTKVRESLAGMTDLELAQWGLSRKPPPPGVISGRALLGVVGNNPGQPQSVFGTTFDKAVPRVLSLGAPAAFDIAARFPPPDSEAYWSGLRGDSVWNTLAVGTRHAAAVLTYGSGASSHRVVFDWRPGTYNLPPIEAMELSVIAYGSGWAGLAGFTFAASCSPGMLFDAHVPTVTGVCALGAGMINRDAIVAIPAGARAFDVWSHDGLGSVVATPTRGQCLIRDYNLGLFQPGGLVECEYGDLAIHAEGIEYAAVNVGCKFFLAL